MATNYVHAVIARLFRERLNVEIESTDTDLFETGTLDSMSFVELLVQLEREFRITVSVEDIDIDKFRSVEAIATFVSGATPAAIPKAPEASVA